MSYFDVAENQTSNLTMSPTSADLFSLPLNSSVIITPERHVIFHIDVAAAVTPTELSSSDATIYTSGIQHIFLKCFLNPSTGRRSLDNYT